MTTTTLSPDDCIHVSLQHGRHCRDAISMLMAHNRSSLYHPPHTVQFAGGLRPRGVRIFKGSIIIQPTAAAAQRSASIRGVSEKGFLITLNTRWRRRPAVTTTTRYTKRHFGRHLINCIKVPFAIGFIQQQQQVKHQRSTWWCSSSPRHVTVVCLQMSPLTREMWCFSMKGNIIIVLEWQFLGGRGGQHGRSVTSVWYLYHRHVGVSVGTIRKGRAVDYEWACQSQKTTYGKEDRLLLQATLNQNQCLFKGYRLSFPGIRCGTCSYF